MFYRSAKIWIGLPVNGEQSLIDFVVSTNPNRIRAFIKGLAERPNEKLDPYKCFNELYEDRGARFIGNKKVIEEVCERMGSNGKVKCRKCNVSASFEHMTEHIRNEGWSDLQTTERTTALLFRSKVPEQQIHELW